MENVVISKNCDPEVGVKLFRKINSQIIEVPGKFFHEHNELVKQFKIMAEIVKEEVQKRAGVLPPRIYFRICSKDEVEKKGKRDT